MLNTMSLSLPKVDNNLLMLIGIGAAGLLAANFIMKGGVTSAMARARPAQAYYSVADHQPYVHAILNTIPTQINLPPVPYDYTRIHTLLGIGEKYPDDWYNPPLNP
jgi:hypothetical protein